MFAKPYKLKSNNALKNSEKKYLAQRIQDQFPAATNEKVKELVPSKSNTICMKLILHSGEIVAVYAVDGAPIVLETEGGLVPTLCALWKVPELVPTIVIHSPVLPKMQGGAPLYLPGVATGTGGVGFPMFARGAVVAARTQDNMAAALIGRTTMSSADMLLRAQGICLETIHILGDHLCKENKFNKIERPKLGPAPLASGDATDSLMNDIGQLNLRPAAAAPAPARDEWPSMGRAAPAPAASRDEWPSLGRAAPAPAPAPHTPSPNEPKVIPDTAVATVDGADDVDCMGTESPPPVEDVIPEDMDGLLRWCLLSFLKVEGKHIELPLKVNLLYKNHIFPMCPLDRTLDVKKSSYKKMGKFLESMQQEGLLEVRELEKGVLSLVAVSLAHPQVRAHRVPAVLLARAARETAGEEGEYEPPLVREMFCVTASVADLFAGVKKGTALTGAQVRTSLTDYVRARDLSSTTLKGAVTLDSLLANLTDRQEQESIKWDALMLAVQNKMTAATEMRFADGTVRLNKSRLKAITMTVATRSGNKKVTLVSNLEAYGFSLAELARACQLAVGASCGVTRSAAAKCDQLMLQGDQTHFVAKLLVEKYRLPKRYVDGADKALNKKK